MPDRLLSKTEIEDLARLYSATAVMPAEFLNAPHWQRAEVRRRAYDRVKAEEEATRAKRRAEDDERSSDADDEPGGPPF